MRVIQQSLCTAYYLLQFLFAVLATYFVGSYKVTYSHLDLANYSAIKRAANIGQVRVLKTAQKINKNYSLKRIQK